MIYNFYSYTCKILNYNNISIGKNYFTLYNSLPIVTISLTKKHLSVGNKIPCTLFFKSAVPDSTNKYTIRNAASIYFTLFQTLKTILCLCARISLLLFSFVKRFYLLETYLLWKKKLFANPNDFCCLKQIYY